MRFDIIAAQTVSPKSKKVPIRGASSIDLFEKDDIRFITIYVDLKEKDRSFGLMKASSREPRKFYLSLEKDIQFDFYGKAVEAGGNWVKLIFVDNGLEDVNTGWGSVNVKKVDDSEKSTQIHKMDFDPSKF